MPPLLIKICGMRRQEDLDEAAGAGASMCGFIFASQSPRMLSPAQAAALNSHSMRRVGVFLTDDTVRIEHAAAQARLDYIQLHGDQPESCAGQLAGSLGAERIIRVLWPDTYASRKDLEKEMLRHAPCTGMFLLDAGTHGGGSGQRIALHLQNLHAPRPWILAGGLTPENAAEAVRMYRPDGVDFNSGLESSPGCKTAEHIRTALAALRNI